VNIHCSCSPHNKYAMLPSSTQNENPAAISGARQLFRYVFRRIFRCIYMKSSSLLPFSTLLFIGLGFSSSGVAFAQPRSQKIQPPSRLNRLANPRQEWKLGELTGEEARPKNHNGLTSIGVGRHVSSDVMQRGEWNTMPTGQRVWRVSLRSPGAWGMRVHFTDFQIGQGSIWIYPSSTDVVDESKPVGIAGPYTGAGIFDDGEFWSEPVQGESITLEYLPADPDSGLEPEFRIDSLSHLFRSVMRNPDAAAIVNADAPGLSDSISLTASNPLNTAVQNTCSPDVSCFSNWQPQASAVASITFIQNGASYLCSGALIADPSISRQPYFLTANHCVSDDLTARTVVAHFQYQSAVCNGPVQDYSQVPRVTGGHYLVSAPISGGDFSLLLLAGDPPPGSAFLAWSPGIEPALGEQVVGIHHPGFTLGGTAPSATRISFGTRWFSQDVSVEGEVMPSGKNIFVGWLPGQGYTEPGSSGSPLLSATGQLLGTLTGGSEGQFLAACTPSHPVAVYGKLASALPSIAPFLGCTYSAALNGPQTFSSMAGQGGIAVTAAQPACAWQAITTDPWIHIASTGYGAGSSTVAFTLDPNTTALARTGSVTVAGKNITIAQQSPQTTAALSCIYKVVPGNITIPAPGGSAVSGVVTTPGCTWSASSNSSWLFLVSTASGSGSATLTFTGVPNTTAFPRVAAINVAGQAVQVLQPAAAAPQLFTDVALANPFSDYITLVSNANLIGGCGPAQYCPDSAITRAQMAVFLVRGVLGTDNFSFTATPYFADVQASHPQFKFIQKLRDLGITAGCSAAPAQFCPDYEVTRGQMSVFLVRSKAGDTFTYSKTPYFTDVPANDPSFPYVQKMRDLGVTSGCSATQYCSTASNTRGQMAVFLVRTFLSGTAFF
jgi:hypothetical protein